MSQNKLYEKIFKYNEFYLIKEKTEYKITIEIIKNDIFIKCNNNFEINLNNNYLSILKEAQLIKKEDVYEFFINLLENKKVIIKNIFNNISIKLYYLRQIFLIKKKNLKSFY